MYASGCVPMSIASLSYILKANHNYLTENDKDYSYSEMVCLTTAKMSRSRPQARRKRLSLWFRA